MNVHSRCFWFSGKGLAAIGLIAAVSYFLLVEHRQHLFVFLPYLILLLCPLMHVFMHHGHGHKHDADGDSDAYKRGVEAGKKLGRNHIE